MMVRCLAGTVPEDISIKNHRFKLLHLHDSTVAAQYFVHETPRSTSLVQLN